jgi:hypothetical protein
MTKRVMGSTHVMCLLKHGPKRHTLLGVHLAPRGIGCDYIVRRQADPGLQAALEALEHQRRRLGRMDSYVM